MDIAWLVLFFAAGSILGLVVAVRNTYLTILFLIYLAILLVLTALFRQPAVTQCIDLTLL